ncbi:MAG TPA: signal peptidase I [Bacillota bacterium]|nr:signal peptidase I [Bacillota bacterium]HPF42889.1 signal peptidase I [Bacillota bacterium]HPJ86359.1 signal peptidase I [Bacillota bacterium]HPQ62387.1 signal peptidase I [Bacillota bacterium]HRX92078.1 signal peptidase I [Candidatus Izemoplasmatales bacterium]
MKKKKKIGTFLLQFLPLILIIFSLVLIGKSILSLQSGKTPTIFKYAVLYIEPDTDSMVDVIMPSDIIFVDTRAHDYQEGDIISFWAKDRVGGTLVTLCVTHEIIAIDTTSGEKVYITQGVNNPSPDSWADGWEITDDKIIGLYVGRSAFLGNVYKLVAANKLGVAYAGVIIVFLLIIISEIANITKEVALGKQKQATMDKEKMIQEELEKLKSEHEDRKDNGPLAK